MGDIVTARLRLHAVDVEEATTIRNGSRVGQRWAHDFPFEGDLVALGGFLAASEAHGEQRPFGYYLIRDGDGVAVGGIGFIGPPSAGAVEIGYGFAPSARRQGYASEAVAAFVRLAATLGVRRVDAETEPDNVASIKTLQKNDFYQVEGADNGHLCWHRQVG